MPTDDIALLNQLRKDGEITEEQYEALRRHVLWGTPLPELLEEEFGGGGPVVPAAEAEPTSQAEPTELPESTELPTELPESLDLPEPVRPATPPPRKFTPTLPTRRTDGPSAPATSPRSGPAFTPQLRGRPERPPRTAPQPPPHTGPAPGQPIRPAAPQHPPVRPPAQQPPAQQPPAQQRPPVRQPAPHTPPRNNSGSLKVPLLAGGVTVVVLLAALGAWWFGFRGDGAVTSAKYASVVCPDLASWQGDIAKSAGAMTSSVNNAADSRTKQKAAQSYFQTAGTRTGQLVTALGGDGKPKADTSYGGKLQDAARSAAAEFKSSAQQTGELETSASSFGSGLQVIIHDPQQPVSRIQDALGSAPRDLKAAFAKESACNSLHPPAP